MKRGSLLIAGLLASCVGGRGQVPVPSLLHRNDVIVFQGDSITDGGRWRTGEDYNHIMGQSYAYIVSAEMGAEHPELNLRFVNRGVGGEGVRELAARWRVDTIDLKPNVLSILVGVNDSFFRGAKAETVPEFEHAYDQLVQQTLAALPNLKIIIGQPFLLPVGAYRESYDTKRAQIRGFQDAVARVAGKYQLPLVRYQDAFDTACKRAPAERWSWDGVHPTYAGHWLMAQAWLDAVGRMPED